MARKKSPKKKAHRKSQASKASSKTRKNTSSSKPSTTKAKVAVKKATDFKPLWSEKLNWWAAFGVALLLMLGTASYIMWDFLTHEKVVLYKDIASDSINSYWPRDVNKAITQEKIESGAFQTPSWNPYYGMGRPAGVPAPQPIMKLFRLPSTLSQAILAMGVPKGLGIMHTVAHKRIVSIFSDYFLLFIVSFLYFRALGTRKISAIIGSLLFTFSGYAIMGLGGWTTELAAVTKCVVMLLGIELMLRKNIWYVLPIAVLMLGVNPRVAFYGVFGVIYATWRYLELHQKIDKGFPILIGKLGALVLVGWLVKATPIISQFYRISSSPRVSGGASLASRLSDQAMFEFADPLHYATVILRFFHNDLLGAGGEFKGWYNYLEAPTFYCGLIALLLVPQVFQFLSKKQRIAYGSVLAFWLLIILFPWFRYAF